MKKFVNEIDPAKVSLSLSFQPEFDKLEDPTQDGYRRMIVDSIIRKYFDPNVYNHINDHFNIEFEECEGKSLCTIKVYPSQERVFLTANKERKFFNKIQNFSYGLMQRLVN